MDEGPQGKNAANSEESPFFSFAAIDDQPASDDQLGFESYVRGVKRFLTHSQTQPPLTLSVEGEWGSGKSSFMLQLESELKESDELTVQFNPWRYDQQDALWAAFTLEFFEQVLSQLPRTSRWSGHLRLLWRRYKRDKNWLEKIKIAMIIAVFFTLVLFSTIGFVFFGDQVANWITESFSISSSDQGLIKTLLGSSGVIVTLASAITVIGKFGRYFSNPIGTSVSKQVKDPEYTERVSFVRHFHKDFRHILDSYVGQQCVYVFIDDLDRCKIPRAAELMQSLNLMISSDPRLLFIIGMDREKVAAGIAAKHDELLDHLDSRKIGDRNSNEPFAQTREMSFGYQYLEKFIQVPFLVPQPAPKDITELLEGITDDRPSPEARMSTEPDLDAPMKRGESTGTEQAQSSSAPQHSALKDNAMIFREIVHFVSPILDYNPRKIKKFINLYRLRTLLAREIGLLDWMEYDMPVRGNLTLQQLGKFVAISLRWPKLLSHLSSNPGLLSDLHSVAIDEKSISDDDSDILQWWAQEEELLQLLRAGCNSDNLNGELYSLEDVNVGDLLRISPRVDQPTQTQSENDSTEGRLPWLDGFVSRAMDYESNARKSEDRTEIIDS